MRFEKIKSAYEKMPNSVKFALQPMFVRTITWNRTYMKTINELNNADQKSTEEQKELQLEKLKSVLMYANEHIPYYKEVFHQVGFDPKYLHSFADMERLPLLTKEDVLRAGEKMYSDEDISYYTTYTGGSSGKSLKCLMDKDSYYKERAFFTHTLAPLGYDPNRSRTVSFYGHNKGKKYYFSPVKADMVISPFYLFKEECFEEIYEIIERFKPDFITCYASAIEYFAKQCIKYKKDLHLKGVVFTSENWTSEQKELVKEAFHCDVISIYGHSERAVYGTIHDGHCKFEALYGYTELIPTETENEFQIVCTGFLNRKMPLIRYVTDDTIVTTADGKYHLVGHRKSDVCLIGKNNIRIFKGAMTLHMEETSKIRTYQFVQYVPGKAELHIVEDEKLSADDLKRIGSYLKTRCEGMLDVEIKIVPDVKRTPRGKYIWAISNIEKEI